MEKTTTPTATVPERPPARVALALAGGLHPGSNIRASRLFELTETGVEFQGEMTLEQWRDGIAALSMMTRNAPLLWVADFLAHAKVAGFARAVVEETLEQADFTHIFMESAMAVQSFPRGLRHPFFTARHYEILGALPDLAAKTKWAKLTLDSALSPQLLEASISAGKLVRPSIRGGGVPTLPGIAQSFETWWHRVEEHDPMERWDHARLQETWEDLQGPTRVGVQIARALGISLEVEG